MLSESMDICFLSMDGGFASLRLVGLSGLVGGLVDDRYMPLLLRTNLFILPNCVLFADLVGELIVILVAVLVTGAIIVCLFFVLLACSFV